jgi:hypothetical protein
MEDTQTEIPTADVLKQAGTRASGKKTVVFNPLEKIPTLAIGEDVKPGQVLAGFFETTERLTSAKFTYAQEKDAETGLPVQYRHVLTNGGTKYGIWNCGELKLIFSKMVRGQYIELTYKVKGEVNGRPQHQFEVKIEKPAALN